MVVLVSRTTVLTNMLAPLISRPLVLPMPFILILSPLNLPPPLATNRPPLDTPLFSLPYSLDKDSMRAIRLVILSSSPSKDLPIPLRVPVVDRVVLPMLNRSPIYLLTLPLHMMDRATRVASVARYENSEESIRPYIGAVPPLVPASVLHLRWVDDRVLANTGTPPETVRKNTRGFTVSEGSLWVTRRTSTSIPPSPGVGLLFTRGADFAPPPRLLSFRSLVPSRSTIFRSVRTLVTRVLAPAFVVTVPSHRPRSLSSLRLSRVTIRPVHRFTLERPFLIECTFPSAPLLSSTLSSIGLTPIS